MANSSPVRRSDAASARVATRRSAAGTRSVVFSGIRKKSQFSSQIHAHVQMNSYRTGASRASPFQLYSPWVNCVGDISNYYGKRFIGDGTQKQKPALEETRAVQKPSYEVKPEEQSKSESVGKTGWSFVSKSGRQHERGKKAPEEEIKTQGMIEPLWD